MSMRGVLRAVLVALDAFTAVTATSEHARRDPEWRPAISPLAC
jgi:hypothetical protein